MKNGKKQLFKAFPILAATFVSLTLAGSVMAETVTVTDGLNVEVNTKVTGTYHFAHGFGLIYGAMPVARTLGIMEKMFPNAKIEWKNIFTTAQQRDAMLAGRLQFGSCSVGPFLQGWDKGVDWKWLQTTSGFDAYLMVRPDGPNNLLDFIGTTKKLSPGPNTAQYFTAQQMLHNAGKDIKALDRNWVNLPHPDAFQALIAGQLDGHFATSDFALRLQKAGMKKIASFESVYGALYPVGACTLTKTIKESPEMSKGYAEALKKVAEWMIANPEKAAVELSKSTNGKESAENFVTYLKSSVYKSYVKDANLNAFAESMHTLGAIKKLPKEAADIYAYPEDAGSKW